MKLLVLASSNTSDRSVDLFLRQNYGFPASANDTYKIVRNREEWELPSVQKTKFDEWTKIGESDGWTQLRVIEKYGMQIERKLLTQFFAGASGAAPQGG